MKKLLKLLLLCIIIVSCESEELFEFESEINEVVEINNEFNIDSKTYGDKNTASKSSNGVEIINPITFGTQTIFLYLDMDVLEDNYVGSFWGSFSYHFRNEMSNHFTIYNVQYADPYCENYEKWEVNKNEYNAYILNNGTIPGIIGVDSGGGNSSDGINASIAGVDDNDPPKGTLPPPPPPDMEPNHTMLMFLNANCFQ